MDIELFPTIGYTMNNVAMKMYVHVFVGVLAFDSLGYIFRRITESCGDSIFSIFFHFYFLPSDSISHFHGYSLSLGAAERKNGREE